MPTTTVRHRQHLRRALTVLSAAALITTASPVAFAAESPAVLGTVLDYSAGVPSGRAVANAGHSGAVRYVSEARPGASWMLGKPVSLAETTDFALNGLQTASVYQFGRADTADWKKGAAGAAEHAPKAVALHVAAGGPKGRPIYVAIDDNPTRYQYNDQIRPYLKAFESYLKAQGYQMGVYGNYNVIDWATNDGIGTYFWEHDWGSGGKIHPRANLHQVGGRQETIDGVTVDVNDILATDWGQWTPGSANPKPPVKKPANPSDPAIPVVPSTPHPTTGTPIPGTNINELEIVQTLETVGSLLDMLSAASS